MIILRRAVFGSFKIMHQMSLPHELQMQYTPQ
jgi:hypothetical protein